jgi:protein gp37
MSTHSSIEWTDRTWNPITGCSETSPGCANCYATRLTATRLRKHKDYAGLAVIDQETKKPRFTGELRFHADRLEEPLHWRKPSRVFVNSMSDLFHENVCAEEISRVFVTMFHAPLHTFQILTKRPARMRAWILDQWMFCELPQAPLPNVWLGVSTENQHFADARIPTLLDTPAALRFISAEPLLGPVGLARSLMRATAPFSGAPFRFEPRGVLDWVIVGGESGPNARPMHPEWARSLRDQCVTAGVPFFFKQWGAWLPIERHGYRPKNRAGHLHELSVHRDTDAGEFNETVYHAYPSDANDDDGVYWELIWTGAKKHRELDGREWNEFPQTQMVKAGAA